MTYPPNNDPYANQTPPPQYGAPPPQYGAPGGYGAPAVGYAGWGPRVGAFLIDALVTAPFYILASVLGTGNNGINVLYFVFWLLGIAVQGYNRWYQQGKTGQSWGKKALGIRLVSEQSGQPIGPGMAFGRDIAHILDGLPCYIGYLWPLWDQKKQTFADKILKTIVVK